MGRGTWSDDRWADGSRDAAVVGGITEDLLRRRREPRRSGLGTPSSAAEAFLRQLEGLDHGLPAPDRAFVRALVDRVRRRELPAGLEGLPADRPSSPLPALRELEALDPSVGLWARAFPDRLLQGLGAATRPRRHGRAVALAAARLAGMAGVDPVHAFLAGLLHDIGRPYLEALAETLDPGRKPRAATLDQFADGLHPALGAVLCEHWGLPTAVQLAVEHHHQPGPAVPAPMRPLVRTVRAADLFAHLLLEPRPAPNAGPLARELERLVRRLELEPDLHLLESLHDQVLAWGRLDPDG